VAPKHAWYANVILGLRNQLAYAWPLTLLVVYGRSFDVESIVITLLARYVDTQIESNRKL
jgi:hypothetical protein